MHQRDRYPRAACVAGGRAGWRRGAAGDRPLGWAQLAGARPGPGNVAARPALGALRHRSRGGGVRSGRGAAADTRRVPRCPLPPGPGTCPADRLRAHPAGDGAVRGDRLPRGVVGPAAERARDRDSHRRLVCAVRSVACAAVTASVGGQPGDREHGRPGNIGRGHFRRGDGPVHRAGRGGVLRAAAPQRQHPRVGRPALGDERAGCPDGGGHLGVGYPGSPVTRRLR